MTIDSLVNYICSIAPLETQEEWDNSGYQIRLNNDEISSVLLALEINEQVIDEAVITKSNLIVTHHPLLFNSIKCIDNNSIIGKYISKLIKNNINVFSIHTPFDKCVGGNNDWFGHKLKLMDVTTMKADKSGFCREGFVNQPISVDEFIDMVSTNLGVCKNFFSYAGSKATVIKKVGWCTGAGSDFIDEAKEAGCDIFITGDLKFHQAQYAKEIKLNILDCGHYGTEFIFAENLKGMLDKFSDLDIIQSHVNLNPFTSI